LDYTLFKCPEAKTLINDERLLAYADDIVILIKNDTKEAIKVIKALNQTLKVNKEKCFYMGYKSDYIDLHAKQTTDLTYLGTLISNNYKSRLDSI
jgi:hypothetical protein